MTVVEVVAAAAAQAQTTNTIWNTIIVTAGGVVIAWISYLGIRAQVRKVRGKAASGALDRDDDEDASLVAYENDPGKFVKDLLAASAAAEAERQTMREERSKDREEIDRMWAEIRALRDQIEETRRGEVRFRDALSRWIHDVFAKWGTTDEIPWPTGDDEALLQPLFPHRRPNRTE